MGTGRRRGSANPTRNLKVLPPCELRSRYSQRSPATRGARQEENDFHSPFFAVLDFGRSVRFHKSISGRTPEFRVTRFIAPLVAAYLLPHIVPRERESNDEHSSHVPCSTTTRGNTVLPCIWHTGPIAPDAN